MLKHIEKLRRSAFSLLVTAVLPEVGSDTTLVSTGTYTGTRRPKERLTIFPESLRATKVDSLKKSFFSESKLGHNLVPLSLISRKVTSRFSLPI